jgi:uncharacterized protein
MSLPGWLQIRPDGVVVSLKVQPRAPRNEVGYPMGTELKVRVTAPPVDSAANEALLRFMAERLGCPRNCLQIVRGAISRHKQVLIVGVPAADIAGNLTSGPDA